MNQLEEVFDLIISATSNGEGLEESLINDEQPMPVSTQIKSAIDSGALVGIVDGVIVIRAK